MIRIDHAALGRLGRAWPRVSFERRMVLDPLGSRITITIRNATL
jgi:hypothetical protein